MDSFGAEKKKRIRRGLFPEEEQKILALILCRYENYQLDQCGMSWKYLQHKAMEYAKTSLLVEKLAIFKESPVWLDKVLNRYGIVGVTLHGEKHEKFDSEDSSF